MTLYTSTDTKMSSNKKFTILPAAVDDAEALQAIYRTAFRSGSLHRVFYPEHLEHLTPREEFENYQLGNMRARLRSEESYNYKAVLSSDPDRVVGFSTFFPPEDATKVASPPETRVPDSELPDDNAAPELQAGYVPACRDAAGRAAYGTKIDEWQKRVWGDDKDFWYVGAVAVDADYGRQGMGSLLMAEGLKLADADRKPVYLEALPPGSRGLYAKFGFVQRGEFAINEAGDLVTPMVREAG